MKMQDTKAAGGLGTRWFVFSLLAALGLVVSYGGIGDHQFLRTWDDVASIPGNRMIHDLGWDNLLWMFSSYHGGNWKPLTWLSLSLDVQLWGDNPVPYKIHNVLLHLGASVLVVFLLRDLLRLGAVRNGKNPGIWRLRNNGWLFAAGLLFLVHPQHVESVSWISERKDVLFAFFYFGSVVFYLQWIFDPRERWRALYLIAGVLSLLSKPMAVSLPVALLMIDIYRASTQTPGELKKAVIDSLIRHRVLVLFAAVVVFVISSAVADSQYHVEASALERFATAGYAIFFYISRFFFPFDLSTYYPYPAWIIDWEWYAWIAFGLIPAVLLLGVFLWTRGRRGLALLIGYSFLALLPALGVVKVPLLTYADRFPYVPLMPMYLLIVYGGTAWVERLSSNVKRIFPYALFFFVLSLFSWQARVNAEWWRDDLSLWTRPVERDPGEVGIAHLNLGRIFAASGSLEAAQRHYELAVSASPNHGPARLALGKLLLSLGKEEKALAVFRQAFRLAPQNIDSVLSIASIFKRIGKSKEALQVIAQGLQANPLDMRLAALHANFAPPGDDPSHSDFIDPLVRSAREGAFTAYAYAAVKKLSEKVYRGRIPNLTYSELAAIWGALFENPALQYFGRQYKTEIRNEVGKAFLFSGEPERARNHFRQALTAAPNPALASAQVEWVAGAEGVCAALAYSRQVEEAFSGKNPGISVSLSHQRDRLKTRPQGAEDKRCGGDEDRSR